MKKKLLSLLTCFVLIFSLTACGGDNSSSNAGSELEGRWKIKATLNTENGEAISVQSLKTRGLISADYEMILQIDDKLNCTIYNGKEASKEATTLTDNGDGSFHFPLDNSDDGFNIWVEENSIDDVKGDVVLCYGTEGKKATCYFEKIKTSENEDEEDASLKNLELKNGKKITTDDYEFTLDKVEFSYEVAPSDKSGIYDTYQAESGKVYIDVQANLKNLMKRDIRVDELFSCIATYDDEYKYEGFAAVEDGNQFVWVSSYTAATPLETVKVHYLIECPKEVDTSKKPLSIAISLADGITYSYNLR